MSRRSIIAGTVFAALVPAASLGAVRLGYPGIVAAVVASPGPWRGYPDSVTGDRRVDLGLLFQFCHVEGWLA